VGDASRFAALVEVSSHLIAMCRRFEYGSSPSQIDTPDPRVIYATASVHGDSDWDAASALLLVSLLCQEIDG
jgi:hypothetical protein